MKILFYPNFDEVYLHSMYPIYLDWKNDEVISILTNFIQMAIPDLYGHITSGASDDYLPLTPSEKVKIIEFANLIGAEYEDQTIDSVSEEL